MTERSLPYGPATAAIRRFLQRLSSLSESEEGEIVRVYRAGTLTSANKAAELALSIAITRSGRERERDAVGGPLLQIVQSRASRAELNEVVAGSTNQSDPSPLRPIAEPALAAILALMMQDVLPREQINELYAPFEHVVQQSSLG